MTKTHSKIVDTAIVLDAAQKHKKSTASRLKAAKTAYEKAQDADNAAGAEVRKAEEDHRQSLRGSIVVTLRDIAG